VHSLYDELCVKVYYELCCDEQCVKVCDEQCVKLCGAQCDLFQKKLNKFVFAVGLALYFIQTDCTHLMHSMYSFSNINQIFFVI